MSSGASTSGRRTSLVRTFQLVWAYNLLLGPCLLSSSSAWSSSKAPNNRSRAHRCTRCGNRDTWIRLRCSPSISASQSVRQDKAVAQMWNSGDPWAIP
ncbi:hypothetical protein C8R47DRAFT_1153348 [Mycena vitilis]|nr:hypothetical protein C8R47DRAFT_1153348 [Mycena vitilis]